MPESRRPALPRAFWAASALVLLALITPWLAPQNPYDLASLDLLDATLPPGTRAGNHLLTYWLGTDPQGRDLLSAMLYGIRISLGVGVAGTLIAAFIGGAIGLLAGFYGGRTDSGLMRLVDLQLAFPALLIALVLLAVLGPGLGKVVIALAAAQWAYFARTARAAALMERHRDYITAARLLGVSDRHLIVRHLLPNCLPTLLTVLPLQLAGAIQLEATLSFLGLGAPVTEPSLGLLVANGFQYLFSGKYWISLFPGIALIITLASLQWVVQSSGQSLAGSHTS